MDLKAPDLSASGDSVRDSEPASFATDFENDIDWFPSSFDLSL